MSNYICTMNYYRLQFICDVAITFLALIQHYVRSRMDKLRNRQASYSGWNKPSSLVISILTLARMGFYRDKEADKVLCYKCQQDIHQLDNLSLHKDCHVCCPEDGASNSIHIIDNKKTIQVDYKTENHIIFCNGNNHMIQVAGHGIHSCYLHIQMIPSYRLVQ